MSATHARLLVNLDEPVGIHHRFLELHFLELHPNRVLLCQQVKRGLVPAAFVSPAAAFTSTNAFSGQLLVQAGPSMRWLHRSHLVARYIAVLFFSPLDFAAAR